MSYLKDKWGILIVFIISLTSMSGSLYFSEVIGYIPCVLCWWQRIFMYPLVLISLVGLFKKSTDTITYILPLSIIGNIISIYHIYVQFSGVSTNFCTTSVACNIKYIEWFGFITIPVLCGTAFLLINAVSITYILKKRNKKEDKM